MRMDMDYLLSLKYLSLNRIVIVPLLGTPIKEAGTAQELLSKEQIPAL
jgi:hypothetical protein